MRVWTVHLPPSPRPGPEGGLPRLLPEGFAWLAFLLGLPWLLAHRLWLESVIYAGVMALLLGLAPAWAVPPAGLALHLLLGFQARDLLRGALARRGWREAHLVAERDADLALARVLEARPDIHLRGARAA